MISSSNPENPARRLRSARLSFVLAFTAAVIAIGWPAPETSAIKIDFDLADTSALVESQSRAVAGTEENVDLALDTVRSRLEAFSRSGDARQLRFAEVELARWLEAATPTAQALMLKARTQQARHEFERAAETLEQSLRFAPSSTEAWLLYADVKRRAGDIQGSRRACMQLALVSDATLAQFCALQIALVSGENARAYGLSRSLLETRPPLGAETRAWALGVAADAAYAAGYATEAITIYQRIHKSGQSSLASRLTLADMLLTVNKPLDAIALLDEDADRLAAQVRLAAANTQLELPVSESIRRNLQEMHSTPDPAETDPLLLSDRALLELDVRNNPAAALDFALANWAVQKGLADLQLLRRSAIAADGQEVLDRLQRWQIEMRSGYES